MAVSVCLKEGEKEEEGEDMPTMMTLAGGHVVVAQACDCFFVFFRHARPSRSPLAIR